ncbi:RNA 2',3'-cyclic phosphodiesterase [Nitrosopumilus cobalaminigenes]|uniref:RNA 2',3'-cyclic phosphodiesterase n=1 Tax=Nitrosopumilus cobalaminigenes TaxID=1470066 RepID=A0A7D5RCU3_9ARCH|nr:RNA 2',3'-cyclic phosphodiesterase [Nitrosopumilus cobalaminigenes]QLH03705.1 RNA 2',3'-cyclic phosphodiesterase [Nitrosopumilus cobalaminigenes]
MRVFVAIEITDEIVINSIRKFQDELKIEAKPVEPQNFHFTLQFLGEISQDILLKITKALEKIEFSSFDIVLKGTGVFPKPSFPRVIWVGSDEKGGDLLIQLSKKVVKALEPLGFLQDKPFKPHITVFRIKKKIGDISKELENKKMTDFGMQKISNIKLKKSELTSSGSIYSDLMEVKAKN